MAMLRGEYISYYMSILTFLAQKEGIETEVIDAQVKPSLPWDSALPAATGIIGNQFLCFRKVKSGLKFH